MVEAYLAILRIGATVVLANPTYTASELLHLARHSRAAAAVGSARALDAVRDDVRLTLAADDPAAAGERPLPVEPAGSDDVALLAYTSGTTGLPKAVPLTHANVLVVDPGGDARLALQRRRRARALAAAVPPARAGRRARHAPGRRPRRHSRPLRSRGDLPDDRARTRHGAACGARDLRAARGLGRHRGRRSRLAEAARVGLGSAVAGARGTGRGDRRTAPTRALRTTESGLDVSNLYDGPRRPARWACRSPASSCG